MRNIKRATVALAGGLILTATTLTLPAAASHAYQCNHDAGPKGESSICVEGGPDRYLAWARFASDLQGKGDLYMDLVCNGVTVRRSGWITWNWGKTVEHNWSGVGQRHCKARLGVRNSGDYWDSPPAL